MLGRSGARGVCAGGTKCRLHEFHGGRDHVVHLDLNKCTLPF